MDNEYKNYKADRVLKLLFRALKGESLSVAALADESNVSTRSITRDINDLKAFLADHRDIHGLGRMLDRIDDLVPHREIGRRQVQLQLLADDVVDALF